MSPRAILSLLQFSREYYRDIKDGVGKLVSFILKKFDSHGIQDSLNSLFGILNRSDNIYFVDSFAFRNHLISTHHIPP